MVESHNLDDKEVRKRRKEWWFALGLFLLFLLLTWAEFRLTRLSSSLPFVNSIFFFGLLNINIVILLGLVWLIFRNIGKLFIERRRKILGARLKTKLVIAFLAFSIIPTLMLFVISALYINSSFDKWFSIKIQNTLQASLDITNTYYSHAEQSGLHFAENISSGIGLQVKGALDSRGSLFRLLEEKRSLLALDAVEYYSSPLSERILSARAFTLKDLPQGVPRLSLELLERAFKGERVFKIQHLGSGDLLRSLYQDSQGGVIVVSTYLPLSLVDKVGEIESVIDDYRETNPLKYPMKTAYFVILIMITLVIIFVAIWIGLYMARELTDPVERLVYGARQIGAGNLDFSVVSAGHDEISVLVESFNKMTFDLKENRERLTQATADLERRRSQLEAVLSSVATGVIVVNREQTVVSINPSAEHLFGVKAEAFIGQTCEKVFIHELLPLKNLIEKGLQQLSNSQEWSQWQYKRGDENLTLLSAVTPLFEQGPRSSIWGIVLVIDDMTLVQKGQREVAWREVARRIAHEIKNPLTPIKLSAQRLQRRLAGYLGKDGELIKECTEVIIKHTDELRDLVNEFSNFARMPEVTPALHQANDALKEVVSLYEQAHNDIILTFAQDNKLPLFEFDRDQVKRVLINLIDNAVSALKSSGGFGVKKIEIETHYNQELKLAVIVVRDNGPGMTDEVRSRVFEPYFSTKKEGTGLGLAIAKRIINDHNGFIRIQSQLNGGTQFTIELPTGDLGRNENHV